MMTRMLMASASIALSLSAFSQELEPGVQTSSSAAAVAKDQATKDQPKAAAPKNAATPVKPAPATASASPAPKGSDKIELDTTQISGNRELPKVMYVVPWRRADPGDFAGRPPNSLLDEALTPVDRDVFRRTNRYYGAVQDSAQPAKSQAGAVNAGSGAPSPKDEK